MPLHQRRLGSMQRQERHRLLEVLFFSLHVHELGQSSAMCDGTSSTSYPEGRTRKQIKEAGAAELPLHEERAELARLQGDWLPVPHFTLDGWVRVRLQNRDEADAG